MSDKQKDHGNVGNRHAAKSDETAETTISMRVPRSVKAGYVKKAQRQKMKLTEWILMKCDAEDEL